MHHVSAVRRSLLYIDLRGGTVCWRRSRHCAKGRESRESISGKRPQECRTLQVVPNSASHRHRPRLTKSVLARAEKSPIPLATGRRKHSLVALSTRRRMFPKAILRAKASCVAPSLQRGMILRAGQIGPNFPSYSPGSIAVRFAIHLAKSAQNCELQKLGIFGCFNFRGLRFLLALCGLFRQKKRRAHRRNKRAST